MGRTRAKKTKPVKPELAPLKQTLAAPVPEPSIQSLFGKAQELLIQCNYDLAHRFVQRILEREPSNAEAREMSAVIDLERGEIITAKETFLSLVPPSNAAPNPPPHSAYLYLAQLSDGPQEALGHYRAAVGLIANRVKPGSTTTEETDELKKIAAKALVAMIEIWMSDLCMEPEAESQCDSLLAQAHSTDPGNVEVLQAEASIRLSQNRPEDAQRSAVAAWESWRELPPDDPRIPTGETRLQLAKLMLEIGSNGDALEIIAGVVAEDDQDVEAWYLEGWCLWGMAEQVKTGEKLGGDAGKGKEKQEDSEVELGWEELAKDARDCLETCKMLHVAQQHGDKPMLAHVKELLAILDELGIKASLEHSEEEGGNDGGEWVDEDEDVEMS
ncbi:TPR_2 domain-containing protein [Ceratobasidium theobromae]|uniref:TPR_2 domain-containing protein n=1 Tax=Ceratobasidium theobromae TaxID=1582974 RepID=A0A5N5QGS0_9AGAM|nr:TPR_2 domain-containing protein [Ceratobasidium theobromae]